MVPQSSILDHNMNSSPGILSFWNDCFSCLFPVYPWDKSSLKSMPIDLQKFKELDAYAVKVSHTLLQNIVLREMCWEAEIWIPMDDLFKATTFLYIGWHNGNSLSKQYFKLFP